MPIIHEDERSSAALWKSSRNGQANREMQKMKLPDDGVFGQAVAVYGHRTGDVRNIGSAREASEWLLNEWPDGSRDSFKARAARQACVMALGAGNAEVARLAFRLAVEEAGNLIGDVDRVYKPGGSDCGARHAQHEG